MVHFLSTRVRFAKPVHAAKPFYAVAFSVTLDLTWLLNTRSLLTLHHRTSSRSSTHHDSYLGF
jgi:hypothetical protein